MTATYKSPSHHHQLTKMTSDSTFVPKQNPVRHNTIRVNELDIFYREAGAAERLNHPAFAWISDFLEHVPESDSAPCPVLPRRGTRLSRLRLKQHAEPQGFRLHFREPN